jgi:hypothetical protein
MGGRILWRIAVDEELIFLTKAFLRSPIYREALRSSLIVFGYIAGKGTAQEKAVK